MATPITLQASVTKTALFNGALVGLGVINKPISSSVGVSSKTRIVINVTAITGTSSFWLLEDDPIGGGNVPVPNGSFPEINATGEYAITVDGPFTKLGVAVNPLAAGAGGSVTYTAAAKLQF